MTVMGEVIDGAFYAPVQAGQVEALLSSYQHKRRQIEQTAALFEGDVGGVVRYFLDGNKDRGGYSSLSAERIFQLPGALASLDADYWNQALTVTRMRDYLPQKRRDEWSEAIRTNATPPFTEENVRPTLEELLLSRERFFAERIDGVFQKLSRQHVTNSPAAFRERLIMANVIDWTGHPSTSMSGYIGDLREIIAMFMGRDVPHWSLTSGLLRTARATPGEWISVDGGALRLRVYKNGNAHCEIEPSMAARLNAMLAMLYPSAIPAEFRAKRSPAKAKRPIYLQQTLLPFAVLQLLNGLRMSDPTTFYFSYGDKDNPAFKQACEVLQTLGATIEKNHLVRSDYPIGEALSAIICSGAIPDVETHQFHETSEALAAEVVDLADIGDEDVCLEPSAGHGAIAALMPTDRTTCVEVSQVRSAVLRGKGFNVECADFLAWAMTTAERFHRVCLNPPFAQGRAMSHLQAAADLLRPGGRLVAVLPASLVGRDLLPGFQGKWSTVREGQFASTAVRVALYTADKPE